eukprot:g34243.t1
MGKSKYVAIVKTTASFGVTHEAIITPSIKIRENHRSIAQQFSGCRLSAYFRDFGFLPEVNPVFAPHCYRIGSCAHVRVMQYSLFRYNAIVPF